MESLQMISQIASNAVISSLWQGTVLAAVIWLCLKLVPRTGAGVRFNIWSAVFMATAVLPLFSILTGHLGAASAQTPIYATNSVVLLDSRWALGIGAFWAIVATGRLLVLATNAFKVRALWRSSTPIELTPALQAILRQPGMRAADLCASPAVNQPCVIGFFSPRILIPAWLLQSATPSELEQIVLHESAHLRRYDDWTNLVQKLMLALFPLNAALLWIERRLCAEREVACDESVVRTTNAPREYATCLTNLAEQRLASRALSGALSLGAWERRSQLAGRVESILLGKAKLRPLQARVLAFSLIFATVAGAVKLGSAAQLVSFVSPQPAAPLVGTERNDTNAGPHYQDVVFHPSSQSAALIGDRELPASPAKKPICKPAVKAHRTQHNGDGAGDGVESLVIVTRWQSVSGQQMTVVHQVVRISALSAAQLHGGWFVVQL